jgi:hypothetical protein
MSSHITRYPVKSLDTRYQEPRTYATIPQGLEEMEKSLVAAISAADGAKLQRPGMSSYHQRNLFFFFSVLRLELRVHTLSHFVNLATKEHISLKVCPFRIALKFTRKSRKRTQQRRMGGVRQA